MPKTRQPEPATVEDQPYRSERLRLELEWDEREPEFKHIWKRCSVSADELTRIEAERVVGEDGKAISDGLQMLCRIPRERWDELISEPQRRSLKRMNEIAKNFDGSHFIRGPLKKFRKPKSASEAGG